MSAPMTPDREQEIRAELTAEFVAWLVKRAREHRVQGPQYAKQADVIGRLADKVQRGAVRPNNLLSLPPQGGPEDVVDLRAELVRLRARVAELEAQVGKVAAFCGQRAEYVTNLRQFVEGGEADYFRWQGHAAARRQLSQSLGLPVGWPAEDALVPTPGELAEQRHLVDPLDHVMEHLADERPTTAQVDPRRAESVSKLRALLARQSGGAL